MALQAGRFRIAAVFTPPFAAVQREAGGFVGCLDILATLRPNGVLASEESPRYRYHQ
jgi:hypothetical protein